MSDNSESPIKNKAFINARLSNVRLLSEKAILAPTIQTKQPQQVQLQIETATSFSFGLDSPINPSIIVIGIDYKVSLKNPNTEKQVIECETRHEAQFALVDWTGIEDWSLIQSIAISPYLAFMHNIALRKAELTILEMGLKGVSLPTPVTFDGDNSPANVVDKVVGANSPTE